MTKIMARGRASSVCRIGQAAGQAEADEGRRAEEAVRGALGGHGGEADGPPLEVVPAEVVVLHVFLPLAEPDGHGDHPGEVGDDDHPVEQVQSGHFVHESSFREFVSPHSRRRRASRASYPRGGKGCKVGEPIGPFRSAPSSGSIEACTTRRPVSPPTSSSVTTELELISTNPHVLRVPGPAAIPRTDRWRSSFSRPEPSSRGRDFPCVVFSPRERSTVAGRASQRAAGHRDRHHGGASPISSSSGPEEAACGIASSTKEDSTSRELSRSRGGRGRRARGHPRPRAPSTAT